MKSKDIAIIIGVAGVSAVVAYLMSALFLTGSDNLTTTVPEVQPLSSEFSEADKRYFNRDSVNPTYLINIRESSNVVPFQSEEQ